MNAYETPLADSSEGADLLFHNGSIRVMDTENSCYSELAVRHGLITALGSHGELAHWVTECTKVIDLKGRALLPGINDSHVHATSLGAQWPHTLFGEGVPLNTPGAGEEYSPTVDSYALRTTSQRRDAILRASDLLASFGITSLTEPGIGPGEDNGASGHYVSEIIAIYRTLATARSLKQRVTLLGLYGELDGISHLEDVQSGIPELVALSDANSSRWFQVAGIKIFADLIPPMRQSWTDLHYDDGTQGGLLVAGDTLDAQAAALKEMVQLAHRAGLQVAVHATGDKTIELILDAFEEAFQEQHEPSKLRHYVIHGDLASSNQMIRMAQLGVLYNTQAGISAKTGDLLTATLPGAEGWLLEEALKHDVLVLSSDAPVLSPDWRKEIVSADSWMVKHGAPTDELAARQRLFQLLRAYTAKPAEQDHAASWKGTLEVGKVADCIVLEQDPLEFSVAELPNTQIDLTFLGGEIVFERVGA